MRRPRVIIYDDEKMILDVLRTYFSERDYDVVTYASPVVCPVTEREDGSCGNDHPCADIILSDFMMPLMNGADLFNAQTRRQCKVPSANKAIISGSAEHDRLMEMQRKGIAFFGKPIRLEELGTWLNKRERQMDLSRPLGSTRKTARMKTADQPPCSISTRTMIVTGVTVNMTSSGLCVKTMVPMSPGEDVFVLYGTFRDYRPANVRWQKVLSAGSYLEGLQFMK